MSKLYKRYLELKKENSSNFYLFKSGIFYIFIADDARIMSDVLHLKLTNLNETIVKCGFPVKNLDKYLQLLKNYNYKIFIIDNIFSRPISTKNHIINSSVENLINTLIYINPEQLSIKEAYDLIDLLINKAQKIKKEFEKWILVLKK